jgi:hypothetical protein
VLHSSPLSISLVHYNSLSERIVMRKENVELHSYAVVEHEKPNKDVYEIQRSRFGALGSSWVHIVPVAVTFGILQLSFRNYYWADADAENQRAKLSALQIAAKAHEILILVSLSSMVLHYTRKLMVAQKGISFGLLEAAYQSGLSSNPWTIGNWQALKHLTQRAKSKKEKTEAGDSKGIGAWHLVLMLVVFAFLALFIGPASAITLIPQLGWWHREDLIGSIQTKAYYVGPSFSTYIPTKLFPTEVNKDHLPASFCNDASKDTNNTCPSARTAEIQNSFTIPMPDITPKVVNTTLALSEDDVIQRRMLYLQNSKFAAVTVPNYLIASFASLIKLPTSTNNYGTYDGGGPFTLEFFANGAAPLDPLVVVYCNDTTSDLFLRDYQYELARSDSQHQERTLSNSVFQVAEFDTRSVWSEDELNRSINGTELIFKDVTNTTDTPVLLALLRHEKNVTVCSVQSHWTPTSQWILSTSNYDMATNFTFEFKTSDPVIMPMYGYPASLNVQNIHIYEDWAGTLNAVNGSTKILDALLQFGIKTINDSTRPDTHISKGQPAYSYFESTISQLLAKSIANGLSRIGAQYAADHFMGTTSENELTTCNDKTGWCSQGLWIASDEMPLAAVPDKSRAIFFSYVGGGIGVDASWYNDTSPVRRSFRKPASADADWTRVSFPVRRYGYAYAFQGITMYLSVALLCLHAAIVLAHVVYRVAFDCQTFDFGGSLGSLLILAMGDRAPGGGNLWAKRVAVVPFGTGQDSKNYKIELVDTGVSDTAGEDEAKARHVEPEDEVLLSSAMQYSSLESRYPSTRI